MWFLEEWPSGWWRWSWKPETWERSGVRIPLLPFFLFFIKVNLIRSKLGRFYKLPFFLIERWPRGWRRSPAKRVYQQWCRGFESLPLCSFFFVSFFLCFFFPLFLFSFIWCSQFPLFDTTNKFYKQLSFAILLVKSLDTRHMSLNVASILCLLRFESKFAR